MYEGSMGAASNREKWEFSIELTDPDNNDAAVNLTGAAIEVAIAEQQATTPLITGSTTDGKVTIATPATSGVFSVAFPRADMQKLAADHYDVGIVLTLASGAVRQLAVGTVAVRHGVVNKA